MSDQVVNQINNKVRVIGRPPHYAIVQQWGGADWRDVRTFDTISDDYAWTNAREYATNLAYPPPPSARMTTTQSQEK